MYNVFYLPPSACIHSSQIESSDGDLRGRDSASDVSLQALTVVTIYSIHLNW